MSAEISTSVNFKIPNLVNFVSEEIRFSKSLGAFFTYLIAPFLQTFFTVSSEIIMPNGNVALAIVFAVFLIFNLLIGLSISISSLNSSKAALVQLALAIAAPISVWFVVSHSLMHGLV